MKDILGMTYHQLLAYSKAAEYDQNEKLVVMMNLMAVSFGGAAKDRRKFADTLLGVAAQPFDVDKFENIFSNLATPVDSEEIDAAKQWAADEFDPNDPAFKVKK